MKENVQNTHSGAYFNSDSVMEIYANCLHIKTSNILKKCVVQKKEVLISLIIWQSFMVVNEKSPLQWHEQTTNLLYSSGFLKRVCLYHQ